MTSEQIYLYTVRLNLTSTYYNRFKLKKHFCGQLAEITSQYFDSYQECVDDCYHLVQHISKLLTKRNKKNEFVLGWETNPKRTTEKNITVTPLEQWENNEIVHILVFEKNKLELNSTLLKASINVLKKDEEAKKILH